ncbi:MAG: hypothetical protein ABI367_01525 [Mucilaginibacter sp.]
MEFVKSIDPTSSNPLVSSLLEKFEKYKNVDPGEIKSSSANTSLMAFNGYYTLNSTTGAFFAIDANILAIGTYSIPFIDLLISLDGKNSSQILFTGSFENNQLVQSGGGYNISLTFTRTDNGTGTTATCAGSITIPGQTTATPVQGATYNNPITPAVFSGQYYLSLPAGGSAPANEPVLLQIEANGAILYNDTPGDGLKPIAGYLYNVNMYFFVALTATKEVVFFIMGSAAEGGLACNNIPLHGAQRSLQTIPKPVASKLISANPNSEQLAAFSGYYQLPSIHSGAFVSIQGQYVTNANIKAYNVKIGISVDGVNANGYYFEAANMSFTNNTLTMTLPGETITIVFKREYDANLNSLVTITASFKNYNNVTGYTLFNPVPLSVFGGAVMTTKNPPTTLAIMSDTAVKLNGVILDNFIYVPIMYILASPAPAPGVIPTEMMSFGTNGTSGNTCILTNSAGMSVVAAIPSS